MERGVIARGGEGRGWILTQPRPGAAWGLPDSVRSMIDIKIGRLDDGQRRILDAGAVFGYEFDSAIVAQVLESDPTGR